MGWEYYDMSPRYAILHRKSQVYVPPSAVKTGCPLAKIETLGGRTVLPSDRRYWHRGGVGEFYASCKLRVADSRARTYYTLRADSPLERVYTITQGSVHLEELGKISKRLRTRRKT